MFGPLGFQEVLFVLALALLIFGPRELPKIGRTIGRTLAELRTATNDLKRSINAEVIEEELRQADPRRAVKETLAEVKSLGAASPAAPETDESVADSADEPQGGPVPRSTAQPAAVGEASPEVAPESADAAEPATSPGSGS